MEVEQWCSRQTFTWHGVLGENVGSRRVVIRVQPCRAATQHTVVQLGVKVKVHMSLYKYVFKYIAIQLRMNVNKDSKI